MNPISSNPFESDGMTTLVEFDATLTADEETELRVLAAFDRKAAQYNEKFPKSPRHANSEGKRRAEIMAQKETAAIDARIAEIRTAQGHERMVARDYHRIKQHVKQQIARELERVVRLQSELLLRLAKGEDLNLPSLLLAESQIGWDALTKGADAMVEALVAPANGYGDNGKDRPPEFDIRHRQIQSNAEFGRLQLRRDEINPLSPDDQEHEERKLAASVGLVWNPSMSSRQA